MGDLDEALRELKKQKGKYYRLVRLEPGNVSVKRMRGFEPVRSEDPEVSGTILAKEHGPDGIIRIGNQGLFRQKEEDAEKHRKRMAERNQAKLDLIKRQYLESEEDVKRQLGKSHKGYSHFAKEEE